jgi:Ribonuclease G/E
MSKKMLIDATHAEETRVVVVDGNRVEEFDFETINKRQIAGNIYLAKVTRVEPSLQAAFVDYGGNRHGFLAFAEIHPDYYQIPIEDRKALIEEERALNRAEEEEDNRRARIAERAGERNREAGEAGAEGRSGEGRSGEGRSSEGRSSEGRGRDDRRGRSNDRGRGRGRRSDTRTDAAPSVDGADTAQDADQTVEDQITDGAGEGQVVEGQVADTQPQTNEAGDLPNVDTSGQVIAAATTGDAVLAGPVLETLDTDTQDHAPEARPAGDPAGMEVVDLAGEAASDEAPHSTDSAPIWATAMTAIMITAMIKAMIIPKAQSQALSAPLITPLTAMTTSNPLLKKTLPRKSLPPAAPARGATKFKK